MNPIWGHIAGVITLLLMLLFIGIWIWAWNARHKPVFEQLARIPMEDDTLSDFHASHRRLVAQPEAQS